ncbi:MAG: hypothetical protein OES46_20805 [Gammaproteobacteria bacterium]|nr:hypothetical protein [Gammaproteobacteria bacterium]
MQCWATPFIRFIVIQLTLLGVGGCIAFPTKLAEDRPFQKKDIAFIDINRTTKDEIRTHLGPPHGTYGEGEWWVYTEYQSLSQWGFIIAGVDAYMGGIETGSFGGGEKRHHLLLKFTKDGRVSMGGVVSENAQCISDNSVCYTPGSLKIRTDSQPGMDAAVRTLAPDHCGKAVSYVQRDGLLFEVGSSTPFTGTITQCSPDGGIETTTEYREGKLSGLHTIWNADGTVSMQTCYQNGLPANTDIDTCVEPPQ